MSNKARLPSIGIIQRLTFFSCLLEGFFFLKYPEMKGLKSLDEVLTLQEDVFYLEDKKLARLKILAKSFNPP